SDDTGTKISALEARLDRIEKRLALGEGRPPSFGAPEGGGGGPARWLAAGGGRSAAGRAPGPAAPPPPPPHATAPPPPQRTGRPPSGDRTARTRCLLLLQSNPQWKRENRRRNVRGLGWRLAPPGSTVHHGAQRSFVALLVQVRRRASKQRGVPPTGSISRVRSMPGAGASGPAM